MSNGDIFSAEVSLNIENVINCKAVGNIPTAFLYNSLHNALKRDSLENDILS